MRSKAERLRVAIQLIPDWASSSVDPLLARFDALVKIPRGGVLEDSVMQFLLLDEQQRVLTVKSAPLNLEQGPVIGPAWRIVRGGLMKLTETSTHCCAVVNDIRSAPVARLDATIRVLLQAINCQVGADGEPHLWWRFYNHTAKPIPVDRVFNTTTLQLDEQTFSPRPHSYDGPALLPPGRAFSGLWSLDEFDARARTGPHRFRLSIFGEASEPFVFEWKTLL